MTREDQVRAFSKAILEDRPDVDRRFVEAVNRLILEGQVKYLPETRELVLLSS